MLGPPAANAYGWLAAADGPRRPAGCGPPRLPPAWLARSASICVLVLPLLGCANLRPSNYRDWSPDQAVLPYAEFDGHLLHVHNIRNCSYLSPDDYVVSHYDKTFDLNELTSVDFIVIPFRGLPSLAHTMLSFGFEDGNHLAVSVEVRKERGERYAFLKGLLNEYEIMYVVGDERDLVKLRTNYRKDDVYVYHARATPEQVRALFVDVMGRVNKLAAEPEFYHTFVNNCTTNIVGHINRLAPDRVPYDIRVLLPGHSDRLAYDLGLIDSDASFEETKLRARVSDLALLYGDSPDFSARIRR